MRLIIYHVLETLIEHGTDENTGLKLFAGQAVVHDLVSIGLVSNLLQLLADILHVKLAKRSSVAKESKTHKRLTKNSLLELSNRHTRRNCVWINDDIWSNTIRSIRHIALWNNISNGTLLTVPRRELVANDWLPHRSKTHLGKLVSIAIPVNVILVYKRLFRSAENLALVLILDKLGMVIAIFLDGCNLGNNNITIFHKSVLWNDTAAVYLVIISKLHSLGLGGVRLATNFLVAVDFLLVLILFRMINGGDKETTVKRTLIEKQRVLLIVSRVGHNRDNYVCTRRDLIQLDHIHDTRIHERASGIVQEIGRLVHPRIKIGGIDTHRLFSLCTVTRKEIISSNKTMVFRFNSNIRNHTVLNLNNAFYKDKHTLTYMRYI